MYKRIRINKIVAVIMLLVMILPQLSFTVKAASDELAYNQRNVRTSNRNVDFGITFDKNGKSAESITADVNDKTLKMKVYLNVKDEGYIKGGKIAFKNNNNPNIEFEEQKTNVTAVQKIGKREILLNEVKGSKEISFEVPFNYQGIDNIKKSDLENNLQLYFETEHVNIKGITSKVEKQVNLKINWVEHKTLKITNTLEKYIPYELNSEKGIVVQNLIKVENVQNKNMLPVEKITIYQNTPELQGKRPDAVNVSIQNAKLLNEAEKINVGEKFWDYDKTNNLVTINVENEKQRDETYLNGTGALEVLVTSIYKNVENVKNTEIELNARVNEKVLSGTNVSQEVEDSVKNVFKVNSKIGKLIQVGEISLNKNFAKGILYVNEKAKNPNENEIKTKLKVDISNIDLVDKLKISDEKPKYEYLHNGKIVYAVENNLVYKSIEIDKLAFNNLLGENGNIEIRQSGILIAEINNKTPEENRKYKIQFNKKYTDLEIILSKPIKQGEMYINTVRVLDKASYDKTYIQGFKNIVLNKNVYILFNGEQKEIDKIENKIKLENGISNITVRTNKKELSTITENKNIEFIVEFNNDKLISDIYGRTGIEIELPKEIKEVKLKNVSLLNQNGLRLSNAFAVKENGISKIKAYVVGNQDGLNTGYLTKGTNLVATTDVKLNEWASSGVGKYNVKYINEFATNYPNNQEYAMSKSFNFTNASKNGITQGELQYNAPKGLLLIDEFKNINSKNQGVISINQGHKQGRLDVLSEKRTIDSNIYLLNNYDVELSNIKILGRVPSSQNKDIITNKKINSNFDTVMVRGIKTDDNVKHKVYYTKNPNATNDILDKNNGWTLDLDPALVKSYLIVIEEKIQPKKMYTFKYALEIPKDLQHGKQVETYSLVQYGYRDLKKGYLEYYQFADKITLTTGEGVDLNINVKANKDRIYKYEDIMYTLEVENISKTTNAENVQSYIKIPDELRLKGFKDDGKLSQVKVSENKREIYINFGNIEKGQKASKRIIFIGENVKDQKNIELKVNTKADNFEKVIYSKSIGESVREKEITVNIKDKVLLNSGDIANIYEGIPKEYLVTVRNNTSKNVGTGKIPATTVNNVSLIVNLPREVEPELDKMKSNLIYELKSFDKQSNILMLGLKEPLQSNGAVNFALPIKVSKNAQAQDVVDIKIKAQAMTSRGQSITSDSNTISNFISKIAVDTKTRINIVGRGNEGTIQEYEIFEIRHTIQNNSGADLIHQGFILEANPGIIIREIYKNQDFMNFKTATTLGGLDTKYKHENTFNYPFFIHKGKKVEFVILAEADCIEQAASKTVGIKFGMEGHLESKSITITKNIGQRTLKQQDATGETVLNKQEKKQWGIGTSGTPAQTGRSIVGKAWVDSSKDGILKENGKTLENIGVKLIDNNTRKVVGKTFTKPSGDYQFDNLDNGEYSVMFEYDDDRYSPTIYNAKTKDDDERNSQGIVTEKTVAVTSGIHVNYANVKNVDLGFVENTDFDMALNHEIEKIEIIRPNNIKEIKVRNHKNSKIELSKRDLGKAKIRYTYNVIVTNEGKLQGNVLRVSANIPNDMRIVQNDNQVWKRDSEGKIYTTAFSSLDFQPGDIRQIKLVLEKDFNKEELNIINFEIEEQKNNLGKKDIDSTPGNKNIKEDDYSTSEIVLGLNTTKKIAIALLVITPITIIVVMYVLKTKKLEIKKTK